MGKRIIVTLDEEEYKAFKKIEGFGKKDGTKAKNIIIAWLSEKGFISSKVQMPKDIEELKKLDSIELAKILNKLKKIK